MKNARTVLSIIVYIILALGWGYLPAMNDMLKHSTIKLSTVNNIADIFLHLAFGIIMMSFAILKLLGFKKGKPVNIFELKSVFLLTTGLSLFIALFFWTLINPGITTFQKIILIFWNTYTLIIFLMWLTRNIVSTKKPGG
jgi:hypothetical protein